MHSLIQQSAGCHLDTQTLKNHPLNRTSNFSEVFLKMSISSIKLIFLASIIPMALYMDILPYFNK